MALAGTYPIGYYLTMIEIRQTAEYESWFEKLRDLQARARILARIRRLSLGNLGDIKPVGEGVSELRITYGPGYRIYVKQQGDVLVILLVGGDKSSQKHDIERAKELARDL
jgi:putative addiction module killer protein